MKRQMMRLLGGFVLITLLAVYFGKVLETVFLFGSLFLLRSQAGGYHFHSFLGKILFALVITGIMLFLEGIHCSERILLILLLFANLTVIFLAPATNEENIKLDVEERRVMKNKAMFLTGGMSVFVLVMKESPLMVPVLVALIAETVSIVKVLVSEFLKEQSHTI